MDRKRPVLGGSVRFPQYLGLSWTGCGPRLPVFGAKNRTEPDLRTLIEIQLVIVPFRFGHDGNAASVESIAQWAGVSAGMVVKVTRRVIIASLALHDEVIHWPSAAEKEVAKEWVEANLCPVWRDGFCMVYFNLDPLV